MPASRLARTVNIILGEPHSNPLTSESRNHHASRMSDRSIIGWDIGGVNTKVARVQRGTVLAARSHPYEIQRDPHALAPLLARSPRSRCVRRRPARRDDDRRALAECSARSAKALRSCSMPSNRRFPHADISRLHRRRTLHLRHPTRASSRSLSPRPTGPPPRASSPSTTANAILIDIGTTTTDIIPIVGGSVVALGTTDPARLASGELVYTGALRTPVEAITHHVPLGDVARRRFSRVVRARRRRRTCGAATSPSDDYSVTTPDGRPTSREFAGERIARVVCADREMLERSMRSPAIADAVATAQVDQICRGDRPRSRATPDAPHSRSSPDSARSLPTRAARQAGLAVSSAR